MKNNKILKEIKLGKVKMKPRWEFTLKKWGEIEVWMGMVGLVVVGIMGIAYFLEIYRIEELNEFGDLGWQIFYEDFPYIWMILAIVCLMLSYFVLINMGQNYKKIVAKNFGYTGGDNNSGDYCSSVSSSLKSLSTEESSELNSFNISSSV